MSPSALDTGPEVSVPADEEFVLDMRVVESTTPIAEMMCDTSDNCGSTCSGSACATSSNDPS
jgi:FxLD family lantipeptide